MRGFAHFYLIRNEPDRRQLAVTLRGLGRQKCVLSMEEDKCRECLGRIFAEYWQSARLPTAIDRAQSLKEFIASCPCSTLILDGPDESDRSFFLRQVRGGGYSGEFVSRIESKPCMRCIAVHIYNQALGRRGSLTASDT